MAERTTRSRVAAKAAAPRTRATKKTDLEHFVAAAGRAAKVRDVRKQINASGVEYIYYQFPSVTGRIMGKGVPAKHWESIAAEGLPARLRRDGEPLHRPPRQLHRLRPRGRRSSSASRSPRRSSRSRGTRRSRASGARCFRNREEREDPGAFLTSDCRGNLQRIQADFEADDRAAPARRHRARDDVAQAEPGRHALGRGHVQALLLPHRSVQRVPAADPQGDRVRRRRSAST